MDNSRANKKDILNFFQSLVLSLFIQKKKSMKRSFLTVKGVFLFFFFSGACNLTECNQNCATLKFFRFCNLLFRVLKLNRSHTLATVPRFVTSLIMSLAVPVCNIKRILCSDRQPKWARWAWDCPL